MTSDSQIINAFNQVPYSPHWGARHYFLGLLKWKEEMPVYLLEQCAKLVQSGHGHGAIHFQALTTTLGECGRLVSGGEIFWADQLPTAPQLWDMVKDNRVYVFDNTKRRWCPQSRSSDYILPGNLMPSVGGLRSLLKPEIGRRVARMHGTTKGRWERDARAF